ncbi:hypothetical protein KEM54_006557, partial [Ascosphaera aggregata]
HVLRIPASGTSGINKEGPNVRDSRGKARQISTFNGRTVVVKEASVFSNKGFKNFNQAHLLSDVLYYHPNNDNQPWLIYYISKPLLGTYETARIVPAVVPGPTPSLPHATSSQEAHDMQMDHITGSFTKKEIKTFHELLANFPMIARQMEPGLDRLFTEFAKELGAKPLPPRPSETPTHSSSSESADWSNSSQDATASTSAAAAAAADTTPASDLHEATASTAAYSPEPLPFNSSDYFEDDEDLMRRALETAVTSAIDLFRLVDKQQLSLLGATTDLTGPLVERLIERHVVQQVHSSLLFPRLCSCHRTEDLELDAHIRQMEDLDVSQVGIAIEDGRQGKRDLIRRIDRGVVEFRKMADAECPQAMSDALLATIKAVSLDEEDTDSNQSEKRAHVVTVNADVLVSLLLMVIVRAQVRHLMSRLVYMQSFIFIDDVEGGEIGYGLSTLEVVLTYLLRDSISLRKASARNARLWKATKEGRVADMRAILEPGDDDNSDYGIDAREDESRLYGLSSENLNRNNLALQKSAQDEPENPGLSHVFPFLTWSQFSHLPQKKPKRVSMDVRSLSESSSTSVLSRTTTIGSNLDAVEGDMSIENLTKTQDSSGSSIPMMAVEASQPASLSYLLSLTQYYPIDSILEDTNNYGTTLFSAAVQLGNRELIDIMLNYLSKCPDKEATMAYYAKADSHGRTIAHYLFSEPRLLSQLGCDLQWTLKDHNGQTPLFALCRSYDHPYYNKMVNEALTVAKMAQGDGLPLRLDDHVDLKGNTLLHIVSDPQIIYRILAECDCDPNATNDKRFTPLMMASKYGRVDLVRTLFSDQRVDISLREMRGLTAVELAKDEDVRNRIDDLILFSNTPSNPADPSGRITTVVRSIFVEDASVRFIIKSGAPSNQQRVQSTYTITTCRRSLTDFENLLKFLRVEHPASYIPEGPQYPSPFQIPSKPSRAVLHEMQDHLDLLLKTLLAHPTFGLHELLWEFFLVPEMETEMIGERSQRKAAVLAETIADDYRPVTKEGVKEIEQVVSYTQEAVQAVHSTSCTLIQHGFSLHNAACDVNDSLVLLTHALASLQTPTNALPTSYVETFARFASYFSSSAVDSSPLKKFLTSLMSSYRTTSAILESLARPVTLISKLNASTRTLSRLHSSLASSTMPRKFSFPVLEESRQKSVRDLEAKVLTLTNEIEQLSKEISWNKDVIVGELAGWTSWREVVGREALRKYVRLSLVREKERGRRLERCLRNLREVRHHTP